jgi:serine/threonine protein kinase
VNITQREKLATWHRTDIALTDVYEIMETIGQGHMGEVYKVRRKVENRGLHNKETRERTSSSSHIVDETELTGRGNGSLRSVSNSQSERSNVSTKPSRSNPIFFKSRRERKLLKLKNEQMLQHLQEERRKAQQEEAARPVSVSNVPAASPNGKAVPKSILKNPNDVNPKDLETLARMNKEHNQDGDDDDDDDDVIHNKGEHVGLDYETDVNSIKEKMDTLNNHNTDANPKTIVQHKDSKLLHPHFLPTPHGISDNSVSDDISDVDGIMTNGQEESESEHDSDRLGSGERKNKRWVPKRTIRFQRLYACKTIATEKIKQGQLQELLNEIYMMRKMDHPYIIRLYEVYQVKSKCC